MRETHGRLRVTSVARTLIDLGDRVARPSLDLAFSDAPRQHHVTLDYLRDQLRRSRRQRNVVALRAAYVDRRLAIAVDGYGFHSRFYRFQRDRERRRALKRLHWNVVEFTAQDIRQRPCETVHLLSLPVDPGA